MAVGVAFDNNNVNSAIESGSSYTRSCNRITTITVMTAGNMTRRETRVPAVTRQGNLDFPGPLQIHGQHNVVSAEMISIIQSIK